MTDLQADRSARALVPGRYGMTAEATATYDALQEARHPLDMAVAALLGAAQGTAPADRWQKCAEQIELARQSLDQAAVLLAAARLKNEIVIGAGSPETSALTHCPTCGAPEWREDGRPGWNPVDVECENCAGTYSSEDED